MVGGFGMIDNQTVMFIGQQKGRNTKTRQYRTILGVLMMYYIP